MLALTLLAVVEVLAQVEEPSYPRIVRKDDGRTCIQSLDEKKQVVETCRGAEQGWDAPAREPDKSGATNERAKRSAKLVPALTAPGLLSPEVAGALSTAMTKKAFSAISLWTGAGFVLASLVVAVGGANAPEPARSSPAYAQGALLYGVIGAAFIGAGVALHFSADGNIAAVTAGGAIP